MGCSGTSSCFFTWTAALGKILNVNNLRKQNIVIIDWCCIYRNTEQTVQYFPLHCLVGRDFFFLEESGQRYWVSCDCIIQGILVYVKDCDSNVGLLARSFHHQRSLKIQKDFPYLQIVGNLVRKEESLKFAGVECPHHVIKHSVDILF